MYFRRTVGNGEIIDYIFIYLGQDEDGDHLVYVVKEFSSFASDWTGTVQTVARGSLWWNSELVEDLVLECLE